MTKNKISKFALLFQSFATLILVVNIIILMRNTQFSVIGEYSMIIIGIMTFGAFINYMSIFSKRKLYDEIALEDLNDKDKAFIIALKKAEKQKKTVTIPFLMLLILNIFFLRISFVAQWLFYFWILLIIVGIATFIISFFKDY